MRNIVSPKLRTAFGKVVKYKQKEGYGWIVLNDERWNDCFVSYRDVEPEKEGRKILNIGDKLEFDLHQNEKGYIAKNVKVLSNRDYNTKTENLYEC